MAEDRIKQWIEKKLEKGVDEKRIRESLENTGHDPDLVDEVAGRSDIDDDPFDEGDEEEQESSDETDSEQEESEYDFAARSESKDNDDEDGSGKVPGVDSVPVGKRGLSVVLIAALILMGMTGVFSYVNTSEVLEPKCSGDQGAGVKVYSVTKDQGVTTAEIRVVEDVNVVLEVFDSNEKIGETVKRMNGRGSISVSSVGDRISFHEYGCDEPSVERNY